MFKAIEETSNKKRKKEKVVIKKMLKHTLYLVIILSIPIAIRIK